MAGAKGRSGGARSGAGRKPKQMDDEAKSQNKPVRLEDMDMLQMLQDVALGRIEANALQVRAAIAAVQYTHPKIGEGGKKDQQQDAAKAVAGGRFGAAQPPRLVASNGR